MPELPEAEVLRRGLAPHVERRRICAVRVQRHDLRFPLPVDFAPRLAGCRIRFLERRAKYLLFHLDPAVDASAPQVLLAHLGMSGQLRLRSRPAPAARHDHVALDLEGGVALVFADPRRFGFWDLFPAARARCNRHLAGLGLEPLSPEFHAASLARLLARRRASLKAALLNQALVAGLGNIYVCEALFRAGLSPRRRAASLGCGAGGGEPCARTHRLARAITAVLDEAIAAGGASVRDYIHCDGTPGYFQHDFRVYGRAGQPCLASDCGVGVKRIVQNGRSTFYCPACQR